MEVSDSTSWRQKRVTSSRPKGAREKRATSRDSDRCWRFPGKGRTDVDDSPHSGLACPGPTCLRVRRSATLTALWARHFVIAGPAEPRLHRADGTGRDRELDPGYDDERRVGRASSRLAPVEWLSQTIGWLPCPPRRSELLLLSLLIRFGRNPRTAPTSSPQIPRAGRRVAGSRVD